MNLALTFTELFNENLSRQAAIFSYRYMDCFDSLYKDFISLCLYYTTLVSIGQYIFDFF